MLAVKFAFWLRLPLANMFYPDQVHTEGITKATFGDVEYAEAWGGVIKLSWQSKHRWMST